MPIVYLVRHAQASFGTENYDRLSVRGRQQSRWLGEYFAARGLRFARVLAGTLVRQRDTAREVAAAMGLDPRQIGEHPGLDEYHGEELYRAYAGADPRTHQNADYRGYWRTFRAAMQAWAADELRGVPETWDQFGERIRQARVQPAVSQHRVLRTDRRSGQAAAAELQQHAAPRSPAAPRRGHLRLNRRRSRPDRLAQGALRR